MKPYGKYELRTWPCCPKHDHVYSKWGHRGKSLTVTTVKRYPKKVARQRVRLSLRQVIRTEMFGNDD